MKSIQIAFSKTGYEPFFDYLKAYAIICVLIGHTFPFVEKIGYSFWAGMQVPFFVLIQAFHVIKKPSSKLDFKKLFLRILLPYLIVLIGIILAYTIFGEMNNQQAIKGLSGGGYGPGSYYPWIYIQLAVILHFVHPLFEKGNTLTQTIIWIVVCEGFEILESYINLPDYTHRLLALRYLFLLYLSWRWVKEGIIINKLTILLSVLSGLSIAYFVYSDFNNEPFFYTTGWSYHRWPCYFYVQTLLCCLLYVVYKKISKLVIIDNAVKYLAKCSYEIFLVQMAVIAIIPKFCFIINRHTSLTIWIIAVWTISLSVGYLFNKAYSYFLLNNGRIINRNNN